MKYLCPVEVYWIDSNSMTGWSAADRRISQSKKESLLCRSVGMFVEKNKKRIILTQSSAISKDGYITNLAETLIIPMVAVKKIKKL